VEGRSAAGPHAAVRRLLVRPHPEDPSLLILDSRQARHALRVLRMRPKDRFVAFDGLGHQWEAELVQAGPSPYARVLRPLPEVRLPYRLTLYQGLPKGERMDLVVRMGAELGVSAFVPVRTLRTVAAGDRSERWRRLAAEASKQCGRAKVPEVGPVVGFPQALERFAGHQVRLVLWEGGGRPLARAVSPDARDVGVFVGPEGGLDPEEVVQLQRVGTLCSLGPLVLRTETAAVASAAVVLALLGFTSSEGGW